MLFNLPGAALPFNLPLIIGSLLTYWCPRTAFCSSGFVLRIGEITGCKLLQLITFPLKYCDHRFRLYLGCTYLIVPLYTDEISFSAGVFHVVPASLWLLGTFSPFSKICFSNSNIGSSSMIVPYQLNHLILSFKTYFIRTTVPLLAPDDRIFWVLSWEVKREYQSSENLILL